MKSTSSCVPLFVASLLLVSPVWSSQQDLVMEIGPIDVQVGTRTPIFVTLFNTGDKAIRRISGGSSFAYNEYKEEIYVAGYNWDGTLLPGQELNYNLFSLEVPYDVSLGYYNGIVRMSWFTTDDAYYSKDFELTINVIPQGENPLNIVAISTTAEHIMQDYTALLEKYTKLASSVETLQLELESMNGRYDELKSMHASLQSDYDDLESRYGNLQSEFNDLKAKFEGTTKGIPIEMLYVFLIMTSIFICTTIFFARRKSR